MNAFRMIKRAKITGYMMMHIMKATLNPWSNGYKALFTLQLKLRLFLMFSIKIWSKHAECVDLVAHLEL